MTYDLQFTILHGAIASGIRVGTYGTLALCVRMHAYTHHG